MKVGMNEWVDKWIDVSKDTWKNGYRQQTARGLYNDGWIDEWMN